MTFCTVALSDPLQKGLAVVRDPQWADKANVTPLFKEGKKKDLGNYRLGMPTWVPRKITEWIPLEGSPEHRKAKMVTGNHQHGLIKGKSCLTKMISGSGRQWERCKAFNQVPTISLQTNWRDMDWMVNYKVGRKLTEPLDSSDGQRTEVQLVVKC